MRGRIPVQAGHPGRGEKPFHLRLHLFGAHPVAFDGAGLAVGAVLRHRLGIAAVMADQAVLVLVVGQGHAALAALEHPAAKEAEHGPGVPPAIEEQQSLFPPAEDLRKGVMQRPGDHLETFVAPLGPQVHQPNLGQGLGCDPAVEFEIAIFSFPGMIAGGHLGGGGDQDHRGARQLAPVEGHIPGLVEEAALLLVGGVVFFIHHHQPQAGQGGEDRGAGPHHNIHFSHHDAAPLIHPKGLGQAAVQQGHPGAEAPPEGLGHGVGQGDLRRQDQDLASPGQGMGGGAHVNLGLAAGGHAVQEKRAKLAPVNPGDDARQGLFLVGHQGEVFGIFVRAKDASSSWVRRRVRSSSPIKPRAARRRRLSRQPGKRAWRSFTGVGPASCR